MSSEPLELLKVKDGEIVQRIVVTDKNRIACEQNARRYKDKKKTKERDKKHRIWFFSNESGIPVSERQVSKLLNVEIDNLNKRESEFDQRVREFEKRKAEFEAMQNKTTAGTPLTEPKSVESEPKKRGRKPAEATSEESPFDKPNQ